MIVGVKEIEIVAAVKGIKRPLVISKTGKPVWEGRFIQYNEIVSTGWPICALSRGPNGAGLELQATTPLGQVPSPARRQRAVAVPLEDRGISTWQFIQRDGEIQSEVFSTQIVGSF